MLKQVDTRRTTLFLRRFASELAAAGLSIPEAAACQMDDDYYNRWLALLSHLDCPPVLLETLRAIENAILPENLMALDHAILRRIPNVAIPPLRLDHALELWFHAPEELEVFKSPALRSLGEGGSSSSSCSSSTEPASETLSPATSLLSFPSVENPPPICVNPCSSVVENPSPLPLVPPVKSDSDIGVDSSSFVVSPPPQQISADERLLAVSPPVPAVENPPPISVNPCPSVVEPPASVPSLLTPLPPVESEPSLASFPSVANPPPICVNPCSSVVENLSLVAVLLNDLTADFRRHLILPRYAAETLALWNVHTYAYELRDISTYLGIESPDKQCGKTTLITLLTELTNRPVVAANISAPAFFRVIQETRPTLLIDEADTFLQGNDELRGILNSGYTKKTAFVWRVWNENGAASNAALAPGSDGVANGEPQTPPPSAGTTTPPIQQSSTPNGLRQFTTWCPKAIAMIGRLPETLSDRCITIRMHRKRKSEVCARVREFDGSSLRRRCEEFVRANAEAIRTARPVVPHELGDRAADIWEPLLVLADLAGGQWPELARSAAVFMSAKAQEASPAASLLSDIHALFLRDNTDRLWARTVAQALNQMTDRPWRDLAPGRITEAWLSRHLRKYGIFSRNIAIGGVQARGYYLEDCQEIFTRYVKKST
jgi:hypothetical protein